MKITLLTAKVEASNLWLELFGTNDYTKEKIERVYLCQSIDEIESMFDLGNQLLFRGRLDEVKGIINSL